MPAPVLRRQTYLILELIKGIIVPPCILYSLSSIVNPEWVGSKGFVKAFCEKIYTMYTKEVNGKHFFHEKPDNRQDRDL